VSALTQTLQKLQQITSIFYAGKLERNEARAAVLDLILSQIKCSRISMWRFDEHAHSLRLLCLASKTPDAPLVLEKSWLNQSEYADYFDSLITAGVYASDDTLKDPNLLPMRDSYLAPHRILSVLDCAFMVNGRAYGMLCCEQTDVRRHWEADEITALRTIVDKLAVLMAGSSDPALWSTPSLSLEPIAQGNSRPGRLDFN
jgi:GAF domain-containing protein